MLPSVRIGGSIWPTIPVSDVHPMSKDNRAVITFAVAVFNQRDEQVMSYIVKRLIAAKPDA